MRLSPIILAALTALAQPPEHDRRNTYIPDTKTEFPPPAFKSREAWETRAAQLRKQILSAAGLMPMPESHPLNPQVFGRIEKKDYSIEKVALESMPGYYLGGNLYRPSGSGRRPAVLSPHGHWTYGRLENSPNNSIPTRCINLARQGYVVFAYDMVGYNDTAQTPHSFGGKREQLWSFGPLGLQLWNSIRALDFLESLPDVDRERISMTGASGGGTQTFLLTAIDERVKVSAPVNMISAHMQGGSPCENAPGLRVGTSNVELGALMAPRPLLMVSATGDWTKDTPRVEFPAIQAIYALYDKAAHVETVQYDFEHNYNQKSREAVYSFFGKRVLGKDEEIAEKSASIEKLQDMLVWHGRALPANALGYDRLFAQWMAASQHQAETTTDRQTLRERLAYAIG
ncbi:MAG: acetylxylan esterase, partial [Candidatus Solibacter usitatus]|nr:acetylxylan esterase [Candidatus Solibacter usitatus]